MKILKPDNLALLFTPCMTGDICCISVAAMACFSFDKSLSDPLLTEQEMWQAVAAELGEEEALDMGLPKHRGEFLVYGSCHSPVEVTGMQVTVTVAGLSKTLNVSGDRYWNAAGIPSTPEPFFSKRISWDNAFGGEEWEPNPAGIGIVPDTTGRIPVPPVQDPVHLMTNRDDRPEPAGFTAIPPFSPQRKQHLGLFDDKWQANRWPHYPYDTNPEYFNSAPPDQRLSAFFKGDEAIRIANMHPAKAEIVSKLPGVRSRLFINRIVDGKETFSEISGRAETLWLFPGSDCGVLLFRGTSIVADETLDDVTHLMAEWEPLNTHPESLEFYRVKFNEALNPESAEPAEPPPLPEPSPEPAAAPAAPPHLQPPPMPPETEKMISEMNQKIAEVEAQAEAVFARMGMTREQAMEKYLPKPKTAPGISVAEIEKMTADVQRQADEALKSMGMTFEEAMAKYVTPKPRVVEPEQQIKGLVDKLQTLEESLKKSGLNLQEEAARHMPDADPATFDIKGIIAGLGSLAASIPSEAAKSPAEELPPVAPPDPDAEIAERIREGKNLAGMDLSGMDFTGRDLAMADFSGSILAEARFAGAILNGAVFADAVLTDTDFSSAKMEHVRLTGVQAMGASFSSAAMRGADLSGGDFSGCEFKDAILSGASLSGAIFADSSMRNVRGSGLTAIKSNFSGTDMTGSDLSRSLISGSDFTDANLGKADFSDTEATDAAFYGAKGVGTDFSRAKMAGSRAEKGTDFTGAIFSGADISNSNWEKSCLTDARMDKTVLDNSDFSRVTLDGAYMVNAIAREANFMKAVMTGCDLRGVNFFKATFRHAFLKGCDLKNSNMFGADLYGAKIVSSDLKGADFRRAQTGNSGQKQDRRTD